MLKEHNTLILDMQKVIDLAITGFSFIAAYFIKQNLLPEGFRSLSTDPSYYVILLLIIIAWFILT